MIANDIATGTLPPNVEEHDGYNAPPLFIFVNRRRFTVSDGVKPRMTGAEIAALVGLDRDQAVVRRVHGDDQVPVGLDDVVAIQRAEHFVVTRRVVEGG